MCFYCTLVQALLAGELDFGGNPMLTSSAEAFKLLERCPHFTTHHTNDYYLVNIQTIIGYTKTENYGHVITNIINQQVYMDYVTN